MTLGVVAASDYDWESLRVMVKHSARFRSRCRMSRINWEFVRFRNASHTASGFRACNRFARLEGILAGMCRVDVRSMAVADGDSDVIGVAELDRRLRGAVEKVTGRNWVQGEVNGFRRAASGHAYFSLKDEHEDALIECVMYRFQAAKAGRAVEDGARVQLWGRATVWAPRGRLQFVAERARHDGRGRLLEALERLKQRLSKEGLFARERKRPLPLDVRVVGVVTSAHGAAWHDIRTIAQRRARVRIILSPAQVQGEGAAQSIVRAIERLEHVTELDAMIVGRGGGSFEDLMAFNDEGVVRKVATAKYPVVSAVGHETDTTLCDFAADARAATPSEAAELLIPDTESRRQRLRSEYRRVCAAMLRRLAEDRQVLSALRNRIPDLRFAVAERQQALDDALLRLERAASSRVRPHRVQLAAFDQRLATQHPRAVVANARARIAPLTTRLLEIGRQVTVMRRAETQELSRRLTEAARAELSKRQALVGLQVGKLEAVSPLSVLSRGYAIATDPAGRAIKSADQVEVGQRLRLRLHRGSLQVDVQAQSLGTDETQ